MQLAFEKIIKEITELLGNKEWTMRDEQGKIIFAPQAPKDMVEKFRRLQKLIGESNLGLISDEEFDAELDEIYLEENDVELDKKCETEINNEGEDKYSNEATKTSI